MSAAVKKAIIPVAGLGTRMLPASKSMPKELLPVFDRPAIQYVVDEAVAAGVTDIMLVTRAGDSAIQQYLSIDADLDAALEARGKTALAAQVRDLVSPGVTIQSVPQPQPLGLGHAVRQAAEWVGEAPFVVMLPDVLVDQADGASPDLACMLARFQATGAAQVLVQSVPAQQVDRYGIVSLAGALPGAGESAQMAGVVEKPTSTDAPSNLAVVGRYVLPARVMALLAAVRPDACGEIQLTDAIAALIAEQPVEAYVMTGLAFDCGSKTGYLQAFLHYALRHPELAAEARAIVASACDY
ncbi:UTP--glucose-1-phosphate uridylyltransferase [Isoalcanivorax beigongshangi]|uniref:UTP--glucose-1-phosphate uridylyltransferase n=1 Tax=Isoalcanivorax beigongshangi TaxID=3238810 RepID=A0ABV4AG14_9GAMM